MLIAISKYKAPLNEVDQYRPQHHAYLKPLFENDKLLTCGRQTSQLGGVIIAKDIELSEFEEILAQDPFVQAKVSEYSIIELRTFYFRWNHESINYQ